VPFAHTLAQFPVHSQQALPPTFADRREPHGSHIPAFLPAFPDPHTYQHTPAYAGHATDPHKQRQVRSCVVSCAAAGLLRWPVAAVLMVRVQGQGSANLLTRIAPSAAPAPATHTECARGEAKG
jgi:hypothetical protein